MSVSGGMNLGLWFQISNGGYYPFGLAFVPYKSRHINPWLCHLTFGSSVNGNENIKGPFLWDSILVF